MAKTETLDVGVILERREVDHKWLDHEWVAIAVVPGAPAIDDWTELETGEGWIRYHACMRTLALHRKETEAYVHNLESRKPAVYVVLREHDTPDEPTPLLVALATVSPYDAQDYMDSGEETVCAVALPEPIAAWMQNFIGQHHTEEPFRKRQRDKVKVEEHKFGQEPIHELRRRSNRHEEGDTDG